MSNRFGLTSLLIALLVLCSATTAVLAKTPASKAPAAQSPSKAALASLAPGKQVPDFTLTSLDGKSYNLDKLTKDGNVVVLEWFSYGCPFVKKYREGSSWMNDSAAAFKGKKVVWLAICSSAAGAEGGDKAGMTEFARDNGMAVPILWDEDGRVGKAFGAKTTPHMFVVNAKRNLVYVGAPDESTALDRAPKGADLVKAAVEAALAGKAPKVASTTPHGCSVKYKK